MADTARAYGADDPTDLRQNIDAGARYLRELWNTYRGNRTLVLAAYNAQGRERYGNTEACRRIGRRRNT